MSRLVNAMAKICSQPDRESINMVNALKHDIEYHEREATNHTREMKAYAKDLEKWKKKIKESTTKTTPEALKQLQDQLNLIYTLPIKSIKVVRTQSKTGYLPKIFILTGMIHLAPFDPETARNAEYFTQFVGKTLGRFIIQLDWSPKHNGPTICAVNLTQRYGYYQSACIKQGIPCFGNINDTAYELFNNKKFFELTQLMLDYLENPIYGTPYVDWQKWFDRNSLQNWENVCELLFSDYPSHHSVTEEKVLKEMIPKKELDSLLRDTSQERPLPFIQFNGQSTHDDGCHCEACRNLRSTYDMFQHYLSQNPFPTPSRTQSSSQSIEDLLQSLDEDEANEAEAQAQYEEEAMRDQEENRRREAEINNSQEEIL